MANAADDPFDLDRFLAAQEDTYANALAELRRGRKRSHWSWFVLPQMRGLGTSAMAERYGIGSLAEARAYLRHPVLGPRLLTCVEAMNAHDHLSAVQVFGETDAMKFRSCLTLFARVAGKDSVFCEALDRYFSDHQDEATLRLLSRGETADIKA